MVGDYPLNQLSSAVLFIEPPSIPQRESGGRRIEEKRGTEGKSVFLPRRRTSSTYAAIASCNTTATINIDEKKKWK